MAQQPVKPIIPTRKGRPPEKPVQGRVVDACADHWLATQPKGAQVLRGVRIPGTGTASELLLLSPKQGTLLVIARSWPHAAAYAHVVGQAVGDLAHLAHARANPDELEVPNDHTMRVRLLADVTAGELGLVFAVGYTDNEGDAQVKAKLNPVIELVQRWASNDSTTKRGVHLWSVRLGEKNSVEEVKLTGGASTSSSAAASPGGAASSTNAVPKRRKT